MRNGHAAALSKPVLGTQRKKKKKKERGEVKRISSKYVTKKRKRKEETASKTKAGLILRSRCASFSGAGTREEGEGKGGKRGGGVQDWRFLPHSTIFRDSHGTSKKGEGGGEEESKRALQLRSRFGYLRLHANNLYPKRFIRIQEDGGGEGRGREERKIGWRNSTISCEIPNSFDQILRTRGRRGGEKREEEKKINRGFQGGAGS